MYHQATGHLKPSQRLDLWLVASLFGLLILQATPWGHHWGVASVSMAEHNAIQEALEFIHWYHTGFVLISWVLNLLDSLYHVHPLLQVVPPSLVILANQGKDVGCMWVRWNANNASNEKADGHTGMVAHQPYIYSLLLMTSKWPVRPSIHLANWW